MNIQSNFLIDYLSYYKNSQYQQRIVLAILLVIIIALTTGYILWGNYLETHFVGTFDQYGLPSKLFRSGWALMLDAWPLWLFPAVFISILVRASEIMFRRYFLELSKADLAKLEIEKTEQTKIIHTHEKKEHDFNHALEIETLKQQVNILKTKYIEEHNRAEEAIRTAEEATERAEEATEAIPPPPIVKMLQAPVNTQNEALIISLQKKIKTLQEDLEQSNALIEKLLETQHP